MSEYVAILARAGLGTALRGPWAVHGHTDRQQGWKLHVSSIPIEAPRLLTILSPLLRDAGVSFKIARDDITLALLNEGTLGGTQIGKFMTIYPRDDAMARRVARAVVDATRGLQGPVIVTDLRLGDILYARYGGFNPQVRRDRFGQVLLMVRDADGSERVDHYQVPFAPPLDQKNPFDGFVIPSPPAAPDPSRRIGPGYRLLETLKPSPKGSVYLALDLRSQTQTSVKIIKEGRQHCLSDRHGRDMRSRLQHQETLHRALAGRVPIPATDPYFEVDGHGYLPMEFIDGSDIGALDPVPFASRPVRERRLLLSRLKRACAAVRQLHECGVVHRDLTHANLRCHALGDVTLLDLELAFVLGGAEPPFSQGTPGFMSPQQEARQTPTTADDVFGLGAVMILLLTGLDPRRVTFAGPRDGAVRIRELSGAPRALAALAAACVHPVARSRPTLDDVAAAIAGAAIGARRPGRRAAPKPAEFEDVRERAQAALPGVARGLLHRVLHDEAGLWLSPAIESRQHRVAESHSTYVRHRSASRGIAGIVYVLARLARTGVARVSSTPRITEAVDWLLRHEPSPDDQLPGLHFGEAGVAVAITEAVASKMLAGGEWFIDYRREALAGPLDWPDVTHGTAGQGLAALMCDDLVPDAGLASLVDQAADAILRTQDADGGWTLPSGVAGLSGVRYTGFAHGVAGLVYFLAEFGGRRQDARATEAAVLGADWLMRRARGRAGTGPLQWSMTEVEPERWHWWCHGGPGIALAFMRLFEWTGDEAHAEAARRALAVHPIDIRYSNLSQCHGLSGLGEMYLEAARVLGDPQWLLRASRIAAMLLALARDRGGAMTWLVEDPFQPTGDLMVGCGGVANFLWRFANLPADAGMPLLPGRGPRRQEAHAAGRITP